MESFGNLLKTTREQKGIDIETAAMETSISKNHIEAMESESIDDFPGETYLIGFLRNYSTYLDLNVNQILALYRAKKIQESPPPKALLQRNYPGFLKPLIISLSVFFIVAVGFFVYYMVYVRNKQDDGSRAVLSAESSVQRYELTDQALTRRLYEGDIVSVPTTGGFIDVIVSKTLENLQLITPAGTQFLELSEERELDLDGQDGAEIIVYVSDISRTDSTRGAEVRVVLKDPALATIEDTDLSTIPEASEVSNQQFVILQDNRAYPFTINVTFRSACVFRYRTDNNDPIEDYFIAGDILTMQASNGIRMWVSNINAVKLQVLADSRTYDLEVGKAGKVTVQDIKWIRDSDGVYKLAVIGVD
ncbi:MAG: helix-turn-helix domain-containing protein [Spirochaetaceae bacterium]|nr:helix-turn-helix domain-containing protein [Spirochaetaceae bacterium]